MLLNSEKTIFYLNMDFKQSIIENAWWGISIDYGMLHLQLATPTAVLLVILFMIVVLNKLLFKPVLRTLDNRKETIEKSQKNILSLTDELETLENKLREKLEKVRSEVLHLRNEGHEKGIVQREAMITEKRTELQNELEKKLDELKVQIETTKNSFSKLNQELSASISKQLLS
tara:strand:+ start:941 stop:1459 length:519 start_codon:yes stop_codon:yes gene_type:complete